jgi:hypothetical protein
MVVGRDGWSDCPLGCSSDGCAESFNLLCGRNKVVGVVENCFVGVRLTDLGDLRPVYSALHYGRLK